MSIEQVPELDRPRERLLSQGGAVLTDTELLAEVLGSDSCSPESSALEVASDLMARFGDLSTLGRISVAELQSWCGLGTARACAVAAALELGRRAQTPRRCRVAMRTSIDVFAFYGPRLGHLMREVFHVMCLDTKHRLLRDVRVVEGGLASCSVLPREVFVPALREGAPSVIFVHNHPSGDPTPSDDDLALTARLKQAGAVLGVEALDHIIIGEGRYVSLIDEGKFKAL